MKSVLAYVASAALLAGSALAQSTPMVNTPSSSTVCQPLLISWAGGTPPYFLYPVQCLICLFSILPGGQPSAAPLIDFGQVSGTSLTWTVNVTNSELGINLRDSSGQLSQSAAFPNLPGTNSACLTAAPPPPAGPTTGGPNTPTPPTPPAPTTTPPAPTPPATTTPQPTPTIPAPKPTTTPSTPSTSTPPTPSKSTGAAPIISAQVGLAGALGLAIGVLFA